MATADRGAAEAAQLIAGALEAEGVPYAIGGALALAIAGVPRGTVDVDVNVFVGEERLPRVIEVSADADPRSPTSRSGAAPPGR